MKFEIGDLVTINNRSIKKKDDLQEIFYLDIASLTNGKYEEVKKYDWKKDKVPSRARRRVQQDDILISTVRPANKHFGFITEKEADLIVSTGFAVLSPNIEKVDPYYLYKYLTLDSVVNYLQAVAENSTSAYPSIKPNDITTLEINLPELSTQQKIGGFLRNIDQKIELNNNIRSNLEETAQTLFKRWFVDFEFPDENGKSYKSNGGKIVKNEFGEKPEEWFFLSLSEIANFQNGLAMQKFRPEDSEMSLPVLKIKELRQGYTDNNSDKCSFHIKDNVKVNNGDVIFSWSASLLVKLWNGGQAGLNQHLFKVTSNKYPKWFYYLWTKHHLNRFSAIAKDKATTMGHIKKSHLEESKVLVPSNKELSYFTSIFSQLVSKKNQLAEESRILQHVRDTLLPKLISGEIELPDDVEVDEDVPVPGS